MKSILVILLLLIANNYTHAQHASKIVFFRHDFVIVRNGLIGTRKKLYYNGTEIKKIEKKSVVIIEGNDLKGTYYMTPSKRRKIALTPKLHSLSFIQLRLYPGLLTLQSSIKEVSLEQFKKCYENEKWLRRELAEQGYHSVDELVQGYVLSE